METLAQLGATCLLYGLGMVTRAPSTMLPPTDSDQVVRCQDFAVCHDRRRWAAHTTRISLGIMRACTVMLSCRSQTRAEWPRARAMAGPLSREAVMWPVSLL